MNINTINKNHVFLAVFSGLLLTLACPKTGFFWLAWLAFLPLFLALKNLSFKSGFYLGFVAGLTHFLTMVYWLAHTMRTYGHLPVYISIPVLFLLAAYLALYPAIFSMTVAGLCLTPWSLLVVVPCLWTALEYVRAVFLTGFPWELIGYTQFKVLPLIQISDILGVYGVSFCIVLGNTAIFLLLLYLTKTDWQKSKVTRRLAVRSLLSFAVILGLFWFYGSWRIQAVDKLTADSPAVKVAIVQGNIDQAIKWDPAFQRSSTIKYIDLSLMAKKHHPDLIVWPETATPFYFLQNKTLSQLVLKVIDEVDTDFLIGSPSFFSGKQKMAYYNSAYLVGPQGKRYGRYDKTHLVPFGEYVPLKKWLPFIDKMVQGVGDFHPGKKGRAIAWGNYRLGVQICYEIIFPTLARAMTQNNASLLINITNDAWYGRSSAPYQHFSMTIFRAIENRRALVRAANTGISGFVDPAGRIVAASGLFEDTLLTHSIPLLQTKTFYSRHGDLFAMLCLAITSALSISLIFRREKTRKKLLF